MKKLTVVYRPLLLLKSVALVGCAVSPQTMENASAPYMRVQVQTMSAAKQTKIAADAASAGNAISRMDAYRERISAQQQ